MNKKADANMWWIIIGAVIALVVLVILMLLFTTKTTKLEGGLLDCQSKGGECIAETACSTPPAGENKGTVSKAFDCSNPPGSVCCFRTTKAS